MTQNDKLLRSLGVLFRQYQRLIAILIFLIGIGLRLYSLNQTNELWTFVGEIGTFLAASIAIPFIYERFLKTVEQQLFLEAIEKVLNRVLDDKSLSERQLIVGEIEKKILGLNLLGSSSPRFNETGRVSLENKKDFLETARHEVIHIAISASTFASYFTQRSYYDFKKFIEDLLKQGVNFKFLFLDPASSIAQAYANDRGEPKLPDKIRESIETFVNLRDEFEQAGYPGRFELFTYSHFPYYYALMIDPENEEGRVSVSNYLYGLKRADNPVIEIHKSSAPILFEKYWESVNKLLKTSSNI
jgi:hypothetical protein